MSKLVQNIRETKRKKGEAQGKGKAGKEVVKDGGEAVAAGQHRRAQ